MPDDKVKREEPRIRIPQVAVHTTARDLATLGETAKASQSERINWAGQISGIPKAWSETEGENSRVAVLDTGVDLDHPDLVEAISATADFTGEGVQDENGHGTHCAGVIAARLNAVGFVGVAPKAQLMVGKVLRSDGNGSYAAIATGIDWAVANGADVISLSFGGRVSSSGLFESVHNALAKGVAMICAAGNEGSLYANGVGYPGRYGSVITVAAHDQNGNRAGFSSRGGEIDLMGPGTEIWSTYKDGGYASLSGTSMATPFVAGLAALAISKHRVSGAGRTPLSNNEDLRAHLMHLAAHPGYHDAERGYGPLLPFQRL